jgi:catechol 2,3-dioxygenase-like lactoylglutathione lyase family enzyme
VFTYVCLGSADLRRSVAFYDPVMGALGLGRCDTGDEDESDWLGWGAYADAGQFELALWLCEPFNGQPPTAGNGTMVALRAASWQQVRSFHEQALLHGGTSEGEPGLRPHYGAEFYVAYVRDPDGNKLAAVCRGVLAED